MSSPTEAAAGDPCLGLWFLILCLLAPLLLFDTRLLMSVQSEVQKIPKKAAAAAAHRPCPRAAACASRLASCPLARSLSLSLSLWSPTFFLPGLHRGCVTRSSLGGHAARRFVLLTILLDLTTIDTPFHFKA